MHFCHAGSILAILIGNRGHIMTLCVAVNLNYCDVNLTPCLPFAEDKVHFRCLSGLKRILGLQPKRAQKPSDPARPPVQDSEDAQAKLAAQLQEAQANTEQEHEAAKQTKSQLRAANDRVAALTASLREAQSRAAASADQWHKVECQLNLMPS